MADKLEMTQKELDAKIEEGKEDLINKNKDLIGDIKKLKEAAKKFDGVDIKALQKIAKDHQSMLDDQDKQNGEYKKLFEKLEETSKTEIADLNAKLLKATEGTDVLKKETDLVTALVANGVLPEMSDSAKKILLDDVALNDERVAMVGDKTIGDYVKSWSETDVGMKFFGDGNSGGDSQGPGKGVPAEAECFNPKSPKFNRTEQSKIANTDPAKYEKYKKMYA